MKGGGEEKRGEGEREKKKGEEGRKEGTKRYLMTRLPPAAKSEECVAGWRDYSHTPLMTRRTGCQRCLYVK